MFGSEAKELSNINIHSVVNYISDASKQLTLNYPFIKLPSASLTDDELLTACVERFPKVIFSTGMSTEEEIDHAVEVLRQAKIDYNKTETLSNHKDPIME